MTIVSGRRTLHRLIYCSRQRLKPENLDHEVGLIIQASIARNRAVGVTGLLLVHEGWFLQALEGGSEAVMTTYGRILEDPRHERAHVLHVGPAAGREFADWNMCARGMSPADDAIVRTLSTRSEFAPERLSGPAALKLLKAVRGIQARTQLGAMV